MPQAPATNQPINFGALNLQPQNQPFQTQPTTPDGLKALILAVHPNGVASDGRKYADIPALELAQKVVAKFPDATTNDGRKYSDFLQTPQSPTKPGSVIDSIFNAASSLVDFLGGKNVADTFGTEIARIGKSPQDQAAIESMAPTVSQTAGSALQLGSLFAPIGAEAKLLTKGAEAVGAGAKIAKVIGNVGAGAATGYGFDVGQNLAAGKTGTDAMKPGGVTALGAAIPLAGPIVSGATRLAGESLGVSTGAGYGAIKELFNASAKGGTAAEAARNALRGNTTPEQIVQEARGALDQIKTSRTDVYKNSLAKLKESKQTFDITPVIDSVATNLEKFGIRVTQDGTIDFSRSPLRFNSAAQSDITQIVNTMKDFGSNKGEIGRAHV